MKNSLLSICILAAISIQIIESGAAVDYRRSRYANPALTSDLSSSENEGLAQQRRRKPLARRLSSDLTLSSKDVQASGQNSIPQSTVSPETIKVIRSRVPVRKFRPWRSNVKRRPRRPHSKIRRQQMQEQLQQQLKQEKLQQEQNQKLEEQRRQQRRRRQRQPHQQQEQQEQQQEKQEQPSSPRQLKSLASSRGSKRQLDRELEEQHLEQEEAVEKTVSLRFARTIIEGTLQNVRGGARLIRARGNYGNVPLLNKLIDNATLIRENIIEGFSCSDKPYGYYADQLNECQIFHICVPMKQIFPGHFTDKDIYTFSFICPFHTIFSQDAMVCAWKNSAVPCGEAHNLYYMNQNFFVVTNDVKKEASTATTSAGSLSAQPLGAYPVSQPSGGSSVSQPSGGSSVSQPSGGYPASQPSGGSSVSQPSGGYPASQPSGGSSVSQPSGGYPTSQSSSSVPSQSSSQSPSYPISSVGSSTPAGSQTSNPASSSSASASSSGPVVQPGSAYPNPNERG